MTSRLDRLVAKAKRSGLEREAAEVLSAYLEPMDHSGAFRSFHWGNAPDGDVALKIEPLSSEIWCLGELVSVVYEAYKGRELAYWEHDFGGARPWLAAQSPTQLLIAGGSYHVTARGIVG